LELAFENKLIRTTCLNEDSAKEQYGAGVSAKLKARLADFRAHKTVAEILSGNPREVKGNQHSTYRVDLDEGYVITFCSNIVDTPKLKSGEIDWAQVSRIKILKIDKS
jgi:hypothetical protein